MDLIYWDNALYKNTMRVLLTATTTYARASCLVHFFNLQIVVVIVHFHIIHLVTLMICNDV
jgi:hypothetical protein